MTTEEINENKHSRVDNERGVLPFQNEVAAWGICNGEPDASAGGFERLCSLELLGRPWGLISQQALLAFSKLLAMSFEIVPCPQKPRYIKMPAGFVPPS